VSSATFGVVVVGEAFCLPASCPRQVQVILEDLKLRGFTSLAVSFMYSYIFQDHERQVADLARKMGFAYIVSSALKSPVIKLLRRSNAASTEAYLGPIV
jgi:5-oxoprolinase (ATP-hydrolysing)